MTSDLRPELLTPTPPYLWRLLLGSVIGSIGAVVMAVGYQVRSDPPHVQIALREPAAMSAVPKAEGVAREVAPPSEVGELAMVFEVDGATYMKLADVDQVPRAKPRLVADDTKVTAAIVTVIADELALTHRAWQGKEVVVDGTCRARVQEFAVIARLVGSPDFADGGDAWTAKSVMKAGDRVLAARLDGCSGGTYARDAALSPIVVPEMIDDEPLARAAEKAMLASAEARVAQSEWKANRPEGQAAHWSKAESTVIATQVVRHPTTGATWVSVQGRHDGGCGLPELNVWKLYRADADGKLTAVPAALDEQSTVIERLIDVDGDGELEVLTSVWGGFGRIAKRAAGPSLARDQWPFFGCGC